MSEHAIAVVGSAHGRPEAAGFDAEFFGLPADGTVPPDPRQDLLLELLWQAMEDAGFVPAASPAVRVGVHLDGLDPARLAAVLALLPPGSTADAGHPSRRAALDAACRALRDGETALALVGGTPDASGASDPPGGRKGVGVVVLKPLPRALADGDAVRHVLAPGQLDDEAEVFGAASKPGPGAGSGEAGVPGA
ncbi:beta-ketoacyl synthase N-terminal-like domain-containing protein, partial [Streptomyces sp. URMC 129]|uniref:beta-ketoacyl synthase N-terminal-like domain-containing protein n=1 Tax=Streptomyces sp. URMC 129 TaxID=3423407 RepID=UPI003F199120